MKLLLHIGTGKTGTTTIQNVFARCRDNLAQHSILYPRAFGAQNHEAVSVACGDFHPGFSTNKVKEVKTAEDRDTFLEKIKAQVLEEIDAVKPDMMVVSNEHLFEKIRTPDNISRIKRLFNGIATEIKIVLYARPQAEFAATVYAELMRMGSYVDYDQFMSQKRTRDLLDYYGGLRVWADGFGDENIAFRVFDRKRLINQDVLADFANLGGIDPALLVSEMDLDGVKNARKTLDAPTTRFLMLFNEALHAELKARNRPDLIKEVKSIKQRGAIVRSIEALGLSGPRYELPHDMARKIADTYREDNALMFERFKVEPFNQEAGVNLNAYDPSSFEGENTPFYMRLMAAMWIDATLGESAKAVK